MTSSCLAERSSGRSCDNVYDDGEYIPQWEFNVRQQLRFLYRFAVAVFLSAHLFDFLFNPIWMHGYIWCLNQHADIDFSDKSALIILNHQLRVVGYPERLINAVLSTAAVVCVLRLSGYQRNHSVWQLLALSVACGLASGTARCVQMRHRLYAAFHEAFYVYFHFFTVAFCMTFRFCERFPTVCGVKCGDLGGEEADYLGKNAENDDDSLISDLTIIDGSEEQ